jgi:hypothetical protein
MLSLVNDTGGDLVLEAIYDDGVRRIASSLLLRAARALDLCEQCIRVPLHVRDLAALQPAISGIMLIVPGLELIISGTPTGRDCGVLRSLAQSYLGRVWLRATRTLLEASKHCAKEAGIVVPPQLTAAACTEEGLKLLEKVLLLTQNQGRALLLEAPPPGTPLGPLAPWLLQWGAVEVTSELARSLVS